MDPGTRKQAICPYMMLPGAALETSRAKQYPILPVDSVHIVGQTGQVGGAKTTLVHLIKPAPPSFGHDQPPCSKRAEDRDEGQG
ncbi:uncharacterized protein ColSpa_03264 [Colletotrichum spaethianum]|uniref:Uncharacterized protein n=1 Tax=Colletotrichum spaethianum TaxID=700344 RepID=A0AA37LB54_9PEZI|nr:uncharacterized protein ColSpa_03264 [Colletotrichum spaethianum]GKT43083.1 hypothetical protein ColSpa_03264 [Colletotrichum spaethianum]